MIVKPDWLFDFLYIKQPSCDNYTNLHVLFSQKSLNKIFLFYEIFYTVLEVKN